MRRRVRNAPGCLSNSSERSVRLECSGTETAWVQVRRSLLTLWGGHVRDQKSVLERTVGRVARAPASDDGTELPPSEEDERYRVTWCWSRRTLGGPDPFWVFESTRRSVLFPGLFPHFLSASLAGLDEGSRGRWAVTRRKRTR